MTVVSSPIPTELRRFTIEAKNEGRVVARLTGRTLHSGLWIADSFEFLDEAHAEDARREFARAIASAPVRSSREVLVVETPESIPWQKALADAGFRPGLRKVFVERRLDEALPPAPTSLWLRSLADVGQTEFNARMAEASEGDPFEERKFAARDFEREWRELIESAGKRFDPARWKLVDDADGPVGVVLPHPVNATTGTLYYLGVVPSRRRSGLGTRLHALGLRLLAEEGLVRYVGSTDVRNAAMRAVFARNGAPETGTEVYFRLDVVPPAKGNA